MPQTQIKQETVFGTKRWELPPLILHPFADPIGSSKLMESSRATLMLCGLLPNDSLPPDELTRKILAGRYLESRMLYFVGRDLLRWGSQCEEFVAAIEELAAAGIREQSFLAFLIKDPPDAVQRKLGTWGVSDFRAIFSRAIGLNAIFRELPKFEALSEDFIRNYHRYADHLFACRQQLIPFTEIGPENFDFHLYASGEYTKKLETEWAE